MTTTRRRFLGTALGGSALLAIDTAAPAFLRRAAAAAEVAGKSAGENVLVVAQWTGGNDGLNTVIPFGDDGYGRNRTALRIPNAQVLQIDKYVGLHPQMTGCHKLLEAGQFAIVQGVGYANPDRSHFRSMDIWHSAQPENPKPIDGWLGRSVNYLPSTSRSDVPGLHLGPPRLPLALAGSRQALPSVDSLDAFRLRTEGGALPLAVLKQLAESQRPAGSSLLGVVQQNMLGAYASSEQVKAAVAGAHATVSYPQTGLGQKLQSVAQLIDAGLKTRIYYVALDGFDTHAKQAQTHGVLLHEYSEALAAFVDDLSRRGHLDRTMVLTFSEFGRRVKENASEGTDHGAAAPVFLAGGKVKAGIIGKHPSLTDLDDGDLKFHTDFRSVYATLLDGWLGCPSTEVLGKKFATLPLLKV